MTGYMEVFGEAAFKRLNAPVSQCKIIAVAYKRDKQDRANDQLSFR